ncbi:MAG: hypothetical protein IPJ79_01130 [Bacteroidetes bacterium]|nr:hypothetical protein [Bacteroidota bacterium]
MIVIYQDYLHSTAAIYKTLCRKYGHHKISYIDAVGICNGELDQTEINILVVPGGASRYLHGKLDGIGNSLIKRYVANGGSYIGICSGAYYASKTTLWNYNNQILDFEGELSFYNGVAEGPIKNFIRDSIYTSSIIRVKDKSNNIFNCLYWGGPRFIPVGKTNINTHATFCDLSSNADAVISGNFEQGKYLLFSPHLEIDSEILQLMTMNIQDNDLEEFVSLNKNSNITTDFFYSVLDEFQQ